MSAAALPVRPGRRPRLAIAGLVVSLITGVGVAAFAAGFVIFAASLDRSERQPLRHGDGIVALTGGAERVADALGLLLGGDGDRLLISGVNPATSAIELTRSAPEARRLLGCCIELGYRANDTIGNARETRAWVQRHAIHTLIVVTSNYHMPRALAEMADAIPGTELVPFPVVSERSDAAGPWTSLQRLRLEFAEYLKYVVVLARTHLLPSAPYPGSASPQPRPLV